MASTPRIRQQSEGLAGTGLMQSRAEWNVRNQTLSRTLCDLINLYRALDARRALDVGAQHGGRMDRYADLTGLEWTGIDPAFQEQSRSPQGALLLPGRADELPFEDGYFDVTMLANVFVVTPRHLGHDAELGGFTVKLVQRFNYPLEVIPGNVRPVAKIIDRPTRRLMPWAWQFVLAAV